MLSKLVYNLGIRIYATIIHLISPFHSKARSFVDGRKSWRSDLAKFNPEHKPVIWMHAASLGEFEQGRPVFEGLMKLHPDSEFVLSFFSPSGYIPSKDYSKAKVIYLPIDTKRNARDFISIVKPSVALFVKYEFWPNLLAELQTKSIPHYLLSAIFRDDHYIFKSSGKGILNYLRNYTKVFVQDDDSLNRLINKGLNNVIKVGDSRFDRVQELRETWSEDSLFSAFKDDKKLLILGSSWIEDEKLFQNNILENWKVIIAPHEINDARFSQIKKVFSHKKRALYQDLNSENAKGLDILIIDRIGILKTLYGYADLAFIGGGFGKGIHNTLEAAVFGCAITFGPNYQKFKEAKDLIQLKAARCIQNSEQLILLNNEIKKGEEMLETMGQRAKDYVAANQGSTSRMLEHISIHKS